MNIENPMVIDIDEVMIKRQQEADKETNRMKTFNVNGYSTYNFSIEVMARNEEEAMEYVMDNYTAPEIVDVGNMYLQVEDAEEVE